MSRTALRNVLAALVFAVPAASFGFEGRYLFGGEDNHQFLDIEKLPGGAYSVKFDVSNRGCEGKLDGRGTIKNGVLTIRPKEPYGASDKCLVKVKRSGDSLAVTERNCLAWHGVACDFEGEYDSRTAPGK